MSDNNCFRDSLRVNAKTVAKLDSVSENYSNKKNSNSKSQNSGGRERGDEGLGCQGREPGYKSGNNPRVSAVKSASSNANNIFCSVSSLTVSSKSFSNLSTAK